ncbi:hypothetical protein ACFVX3_05080 [Rhodococcus erythropolis]
MNSDLVRNLRERGLRCTGVVDDLFAPKSAFENVSRGLDERRHACIDELHGGRVAVSQQTE